MADPPDRLRRQMNDASHHRSGLPCRQLLQSDGPEHDPNLLNTRPKDLSDGPLILS